MVYIFNHSLIKDKLTRLRRIETESNKFRSNLKEITQLMAYEITKDYALEAVQIQTPLCQTTGYQLKLKTVLVPILRAGLGMVDGLKELMPAADIGHIGIYRDETTAQPNKYYYKMPKTIDGANVIVLDPMLATAGSAVAAIKIIKNTHKPHKIIFVCLVAAPFGVEKMQKEHPEVDLYIAALDEKLNDNYYILPGLGDAGDRLFGTK